MNDHGVFDLLLRRHDVRVDADVVEDILSVYFRACSIEVTCDDLAHAGAVMANGGRSLLDNTQLVLARNVAIGNLKIRLRF